MLKNRKNKKKKGFTLIELVIVLAVMAIIALIAIPNFTAIRDNSKTKADDRSKEVVERTILMLVSDETIPDNGKYTVAYDATTKKVSGVTPAENNSVTPTATDAKAVEVALKDTSKPQAKGKTSGKYNTGFEITIAAGEVAVNFTEA